MKHISRKSLWWSLPVVVVLTSLAVYMSLQHRRNVQSGIAKEIAELGGCVDVRCQAPEWLFHFASDDCRNRFEESEKVEPWGDDRLRNSVATVGIDRLISACDVADGIGVYVANSDVGYLESQLKVRFAETRVDHFPRLLHLASQLTTVRQVGFRCEEGCVIDSRHLPRSLETLRIHLQTPGVVTFDPSSLPPTLEELIILNEAGPEQIRADFSLLPALPKLHHLELPEANLDEASFKLIGKCTALRELSLGKNTVSDACLAHLRGLAELETLQIHGPQLTDSAVAILKDFPRLKTVKLSVWRASDQALKKLHSSIFDLRVERLSKPETERPIRQIIGGGTIGRARNGFDRSAIY